ncbi:SDR family oxidoreductase [Marinomonas sp. TI.3.20]|uniref:SDR family oxidoreductase n=1 Tax=Marinomonas sp. TI.3.20 TaxID=3121296 RepID=UPI00311D3A7D
MKKCVVVTGGVRGIGREISMKFSDAGYQVFATYKNNKNAANKLESESKGLIKPFSVNNTDIRAIESFKSLVLETGIPAILINNAGMTEDGLLVDNGIQRISECMNNNFMGTVNFSLVFLDEMMKQREGNIINISSSAAHKIKLGNTAYGCSKIAIERFSKGLAKEMGRFNIFVNCVAPGWVETDMFNNFAGSLRREILKDIPTRKILKPEEIAQIVFDLAMRRINTTGSVLTIGNGEQII